MKMTQNGRAQAAFICIFLWFLLNSTFSYGVKSDIDCLRAIKESLQDPRNILSSSWDFSNNTEGFICKFTGIECWHPDENKILNIRLSDMGLQGEFPQGLANCSSLAGLDLSSNKLYGNIPSNIAGILTLVTSVDLSSNKLSGEIPADLAKCSYLNVLNLGNNQLTGEIPAQIGHLGRMKTFDVSNNKLTGAVPNFIDASIPAESYANNAGLCGGPLPPCRYTSKKKQKISVGVIVKAAVSAVTISAVLVLACSLVYVEHRERKG